MKEKILLGLVCWIIGTSVMAQRPSLPNFSLKKGTNNQMVIEWSNPFGSALSGLTIQRSIGNTKDFRSVFTPPSSSSALGSYTDVKVPDGKVYYRIYYVLTNKGYYFTQAQSLAYGYESAGLMSQIDASQNVSVFGDIDSSKMASARFKMFRDSVLNETADSLFSVGKNAVLYKKFVGPSSESLAAAYVQTGDYIFTDAATGNLTIKLPPYQLDSYSMIIYDIEGHKPLFKIKHFDDDELFLDKGSFLDVGWYSYDLFQNGKLKQQGRFLVSK